MTVPPTIARPFSPQPAPWSCQCGADRNSALVEECPVCHAKRPYEYTAPEPVLAVPADYPQPGESMEDYAKRMAGNKVAAALDDVRQGKAGLAETLDMLSAPVDPGRKRELPEITASPPSAATATGYAGPISFAGPIGSVDVDPLVLQMALDVANKAASTGVVQSVTVGLKNASQARIIIRYDVDVASVPWPRGVKDDER
jgi:hypothetical protein